MILLSWRGDFAHRCQKVFGDHDMSDNWYTAQGAMVTPLAMGMARHYRSRPRCPPSLMAPA